MSLQSLVSKRLFFTSPQAEMQILIAQSTDIDLNLAMEEYIFEQSKLLVPTLLMFRNAKAVVIGKHQNPWKECNLPAMKRDKVLLSRRKSGGGTVYHDLGNACFSFMDPLAGLPSKLDFKEINAGVVVEALEKLGVPDVIRTNRGDITVRGKKVSGSAYKFKPKNRTLHHGTMLINENKEAIHNYLSPPITNLKCKAVDSIRSQTGNLVDFKSDITYKSFTEAMISAYIKKHYGKYCELKVIGEEVKDIPEIKSIYEDITRWEWKYGETLQFEYSLEGNYSWGSVEIMIIIKEAMIAKGEVKSENLDSNFLMTFNALLDNPNVKHEKEGWEVIINQVKSMYESNDEYMKIIEDINKLVGEKLH